MPRRAIYRLERMRPLSVAGIAIGVYFALSLFAYYPVWPGDPHAIVGCACADPIQQTWFLGWVPWAIIHGHNPFFTSWMDYPSGANLAANTEMPLLGLLTAPLTLLVGPVSSFNLLMYLAFPVSACSCCFVVRRLTGSNLAGLITGLLYGFSPYIVGQGFGHLNLIFIPLPPLIVLALFEVVVAQRHSSRASGGALGLVIAAQYLIASEVLATTLVMLAVGVVVLAATRLKQLSISRLQYAASGAFFAVLVLIPIVGYPLYFEFFGLQALHGPAQGGVTNPYRADLFGSVVPTSFQRYAPKFLTTLGDRFAAGDIAENGSYLGVPLVLLVAVAAVTNRRNRWVVFSVAMAAVAWLLSLGPKLMADAHTTSIPLPFEALAKLPLVANILPARISLYEVLFTCFALGLAIAAWTSPDRPAPPRVRHSKQPRSGRVSFGVVIVLIGLAVYALIPSWPVPTSSLTAVVPSFFSTVAAKEIPQGSIVLTYPYVIYPADQALLWQIKADWRWKLLGGYALVPLPGGVVSGFPAPTYPLQIQEFLGYWARDQGGFLVSTPPPLDTRLISQFRQFLSTNNVRTVLFDPTGLNAGKVLPLFTAVLGRPQNVAGLYVWQHTT